jgi:hypothetical protein
VASLLNKLKLRNPRWSVFSRVLAAMLGGYGLATSSTLLITQIFIFFTRESQAIHSGLLLGFLIYAFAAMWVFSVASAKKAWLGLININLILLGSTWLLIQVHS